MNLKNKKNFNYFYKTKTYNTWRGMIQRCCNPNSTNWENYGGRGIKVCDKWLKFNGFYEDMGERPENMTLDRKNPNGNYSPDNCIWTSDLIQFLNKRNMQEIFNKIIEIQELREIGSIEYFI